MRDSIVKLVNGVGPVWSGWAARTTEATSPSA
jgi:hypothetical protein